MKFDKLVNSIQNTHDGLQRAAVKAVNQSLTVRNWLIGLYIVEFEQNGQDRAKYGERLLPELAASVKIRGLSETNLRLCRQFYTVYPHMVSAIKSSLKHIDFQLDVIHQSLTDELNRLQLPLIGQTLSDQLENTDFQKNEIHQTLSDEFKKALIQPEKLLANLSYSHFSELMTITDIHKRTFFEMETIKGGWNVRELRRQINTLYYERSEISKKPEQLSKVVKEKAERLDPADLIKSPLIDPQGLRYYAITTSLTDADMKALKTVATHSITTVNSLPQRAVDEVFVVDSIQQANIAFAKMLTHRAFK